MRRRWVRRGLVVAGAAALAASCSAAEDLGSSRPCGLEWIFDAPGHSWVQADVEQVDPATYPDAQEVLASDLIRNGEAEWVVLRLGDAALLRSDPLPADEPGAVGSGLNEQVPGADGTVPDWVLVDERAAALMAEDGPTDGWLLEVGWGGTVVNALAIDGDAAAFLPVGCGESDSRALSDRAAGAGRTPAALAVALAQRDPTIPASPGSTTPG